MIQTFNTGNQKYKTNDNHQIMTMDDYVFSSQGKLFNDIFDNNKTNYQTTLQQLISNNSLTKIGSSVINMRED